MVPPAAPATETSGAGWRYAPAWGLLAALLIGVAAGAIVRENALRDERTAAARDTRGAADALALAVNGRMTLVRGLRAFSELSWGRRDFDPQFDAYASRLIADVPGVRSAQYIVGDTIRHASPLAGNEAAVGFDLRHHPSAAEVLGDLRRAESTTAVVLSGPMRLVQGGEGILGRVAMRDSAGRVVAILSLVLDLPPLLEEAGFYRGGPLLRALRDDRGRPVAGDDRVFAGPHVEVPFRLTDRTWVLAAAPARGWLATAASRIFLAGGGAFVVALLAGLLFWQRTQRLDAERRMRVETERRLAEERFSRLVEMSPDGVLVTRVSDGTILDVNDSFLAFSGWTREQLIGRSTLDMGMWLGQGDRERLLGLVRSRGQCIGELVRMRRADGKDLEVEFSARILPGDDGQYLLSLTRDITERRALERKLVQAQRMEAIGRLAGGVAHDFNNILTAIVAAAESIRQEVPHDQPVEQEAGEILRACGRATDLTRQLLIFARRRAGTPALTSVNAVVDDARRMLERLIGADVRLAVDTAEPLPPVVIDATELQQVVLNLAVNARDAMPHGGVLTIQTRARGTGVVLEVRDTGVGIPPEHQPFIFEPFFTTKDPGKGTGLGLATVYGVVQQAGGTIEVRSEAGSGTSFAIVLPGVEGEVEPVSRTPAAAASVAELPRAATGEHILLAEDDPQVRRVTLRILQELGYTVHVAVDGADALRVAATLGTRPHLLATDVVMPMLSGVDLAQQLTRRWPGLKVLYLSGYPEDYDALARALESGALLLSKPFSTAELAAAIRRALESGRPPRSA